MLAKGGRAHVCASSQLFHLQRLGIVLLQPSVNVPRGTG
jgi:hypothetical protein